MRKPTIDGSALALFFARRILGLMFLMRGFFKSFSIGAVAFARENFVGRYQDTWIPVWMLWTLGFLVPYLEFFAGGPLCLGFRVKESCAVLGSKLVIVTYGNLLKEPFFDMSGDNFPLLVLLTFVIIVPREKDMLSVDKLME